MNKKKFESECTVRKNYKYTYFLSVNYVNYNKKRWDNMITTVNYVDYNRMRWDNMIITVNYVN